MWVHTPQSTCWLKSSIASPNITTYFNDQQNGKSLVNKNIPGFNMPGMPIMSPTAEDCATKCKNTTGCQFSNFANNQNMCWLKQTSSTPNSPGISWGWNY